MAEITVRNARLDDLPLLRQFEQGVIAAERPFDPTLRKEEIHYYDLEALLTAENVLLVLAEKEGRPVGCGYARIENAKPYVQHRQHGYLGFMYVLPDYRGQGINQAVLGSLKDWLVQKGVTELRLDVYCQNTSAINAYAKAGFSPLMLEMRTSLTDGSWPGD